MSLSEKAKTFVGYFGSAIGQSVPIHPKSFLYSIARAMASIFTSTDKYQKNAERENLASTASMEGLKKINLDVLKREPYAATSAEITATFTVALGSVIPVGTAFINESNGLIYLSLLEIIGVGQPEQIPMVCSLSGESTNPAVGNPMFPQSPVAGITTGTVASIDKPAVSAETEEEYRQKTLDAQYAQGGGSNLADYRAWAQLPAGVKRAYPYTGKFDINGNYDPSVLLAVSVYVQTSSGTGIPSQPLLDEVRESILKDPETEQTRPAAGIPSSRLYVMPIRKVDIVVTVFTIEPNTWTGTIQDETRQALATYLNNLQPFIDGLDPVYGRTTEITAVNLSDIVQAVTIRYGVNAASVQFSLSGSPTPITRYALSPGTIPSLTNVLYTGAVA
jgi:hypothetical protein